MRNREVQLSAIPDGAITAKVFEVKDAEVPDLQDGQVLVGLRRLGLNAGLAHRLGGEGTAYGPGIGVGDVPSSDAVLEVLDPGSGEFRVGELVVGKSPWCAVHAAAVEDLRTIGADDLDLEDHLTALGHVGFTAWTGMVHIGAVEVGDVVYVSGAAGGVGSCAVQFAKARGARVIGVAGSRDKVALLTDVLGADGAVNRHDGSALNLLREVAPEGIDLYYDNVGGEQLEAALEVLNVGGRVIICGAVAASEAGPRNYRRMIYQELTMRGFTVTAHENLREEFERQVGQWVKDGKVRSVHTVFDGFERIPEAFESLLNGGSTGRTIVAVEPG